jgi:hypothetical protein
MEAAPRFLQGVFPFKGGGLDKPLPLDGDKLTYKVPSDKRAQLIYLRAGNSSAELVYLLLMRDGKPMRYFPIGAKSSDHVALVVTEDIFPDTKLDVLLAAPSGASGDLVIDIGLLEI